MMPITLGSLFEFSGTHIERGMAESAMHSSGKRAAPCWPGFASETIAKQLNETLNVDVFELLAGAWEKFKQVRDCAERNKHSPGELAIVRLTDVEITSTNAPFLQATSNGIALPELNFKLELVAKFEALELVIRDARVRALRPGTASARVCLKYGKTKLYELPTPNWNLPGAIEMPGDGIPIGRASGQ